MKKFENLEEAQTAFDAEVAAHNATKQQLVDAKKVAEEAIAQINEAPQVKTDEVFATVDKTKYKVVFGVDGLTKEEVAKDKELLKKLVKIGSGSLEIVGG